MIAFTLDRQYHCLWKNAPSDSKELFGDDFTKRMTITNNEKIFQTASRNYNSSWDKNSKNLRRFPKKSCKSKSIWLQKQKKLVNTRNITTTRIQNIQKERDINGKFRSYKYYKK